MILATGTKERLICLLCKGRKVDWAADGPKAELDMRRHLANIHLRTMVSVSVGEKHDRVALRGVSWRNDEL